MKNSILNQLCEHHKVKEMKNYYQHGRVSTYDHCCDVARVSMRIADSLNISCDRNALIRAAMLHDFYLYDWHDPDNGIRLHGYIHPEIAAKNAQKYFGICEKEYDIILTHMWQLTFFHIPKSKEAIIVNISDKYVSVIETLFKR